MSANDLAVERTAMAAVAGSMLVLRAGAQEGGAAAELAKKLANPVAALISAPLQCNYDEDGGMAYLQDLRAKSMSED